MEINFEILGQGNEIGDGDGMEIIDVVDMIATTLSLPSPERDKN
jgi:hypothetical protein